MQSEKQPIESTHPKSDKFLISEEPEYTSEIDLPMASLPFALEFPTCTHIPSSPCMSTRTNSSSSSSTSAFSRGSSHARSKSTAYSFSSFASTFSTCAIPTLPPYAPNPVAIHSLEDAKAVLTMDGGGVRGVFAPLFLQELQRHLPDAIDVRQLLDLVGGTSTGGVAALMVARMGLSLEHVVDIYTEMPKKLFGGRKLKRMWWLFTSSQHSTKKQRKIFGRVIREALGDADAWLNLKPPTSTSAGVAHSESGQAQVHSSGSPTVPVFTVAIDAEDLTRPTIFSSYTPTFDSFPRNPVYDTLPATEQRDDAPIVVAAMATSAAPTYFHPTYYAGRAYIDGGVGFNNPSELALKQLSALYGPSAYAHTFISLGTGRRNENPYHPRTGKQKKVPGRSGILSMIDLLRVFAHISTDAEGVHARLEERFKQTGAYYRFNPVGLEDIDLDDWTAVDQAVKASKTYLALPETQRRLDELADRLLRAC